MREELASNEVNIGAVGDPEATRMADLKANEVSAVREELLKDEVNPGGYVF